MKLNHVRLAKKQLDAIPEAERNFFVLSAHAANELNVLVKLFRFCTEHNATSEVEKEALNAQSMTVGRLLTGKLYECWKLLQTTFFANQVSRTYEPKLDAEAKAALDALKKYFGAKNLIEAVRNRHAFHYAPDQLSRGYASLPKDEILNLYLSAANANTLYAFADVIASYSLIEDIDSSNPAKAFSSLIAETSKVLGYFNQVIAGCMMITFEMYIGGDLTALGTKEMTLDGAPDWKTISIPYFVDIADSEVT